MRPTLPSSESCSTFLTFFPIFALAYACFLTSGGGSWCLPTTKSKDGPISSSSTFGSRVPLFLYLMTHWRNMTASSSAVQMITLSTPLRLIRVAGLPLKMSIRTFFAILSAGSVSNLSPRNTMHGLEPSTALLPTEPNESMGL